MTQLEFFPGDERGKGRHYKINGETVPSVTQIIDCLHKPALVWWGMQIGVRGVGKLHEQGLLPPLVNADAIVDALTANKLTVNHVRDSAATRGQSVHAALQAYATQGTIPSLAGFPEEDRGYVRALASWLLGNHPEFLEIEKVVGSEEHGYAGRYDLRIRLEGREGIVDLKTGKRVYPESQFVQLAAYEAASVECGAEPTDFQAVLRLDREGSYELVESCATIDDFLAIKQAYDAQKALKERVKEAKKARKAVAA